MAFNFGGGGGAANTSGFSFGTTTTTQAPAASGTTSAAPVQSLNFSFGQTPAAKPAGGAGFNFGTPGGASAAAAPAQPATAGFSFGGGTPAPAPAPAAAGGTGFTFGTPSQSTSTAAPAATVTPAAAQAPGSGFNFGTSTPAAGGGFTGFATTTPAAPQVNTPVASSAPQSSAPTSLLSGLLTAPNSTAAATSASIANTGGMFGSMQAPSLTVAPQPAAPQIVAPQPVAPQPVAPQPVAPQPVAPQAISSQPVAPRPITSQTATTTQAGIQPSTGFSFGGGPQAPKTTATGGLTLGLSTASTTATALKIGTGSLMTSTAQTPLGPGLMTTTAATTTAPAAAGKFGGVGGLATAKPTLGAALGSMTTSVQPASLSTATTTTDSKPAAGTTMNYRQLEEAINKWSVDLEEQEKVFLEQATQVNAWDRVLIENGEKISQLNLDVERVKCDQQRMDQELDFTLAQQRELQELLTPLETALEQLPPVNYQQHADLEREHTYKLGENIDAQLKRMAEDLKEIIEHVNKSNSASEKQDPVTQIAKILNAHMDTLHWIDQNTTQLQRRVDDVSKVAEVQRKDQERSFRLAYD